MFGKLVKNEFRNTWKLMVIINVALIVMHIVAFVFTRIDRAGMTQNEILRIIIGVYGGTYILTVVGVNFAVFLFFSIRYFKKVYSDEGYLIHTLPVKKSAITGATLLSATVWSVVTGAVSMSYIVYTFLEAAYGEHGFEAFRIMLKVLGFSSYSVFLSGLCFLTCVIFYYLMAFVSIAIGQEWKKHPLLGSVITYWILLTVLQTGGVIVLSLLANAGFFKSFISYETPSMVSGIWTILMTVITIGLAVLSVIGFFVNTKLMEKKLNL